MNSAYVYSVCIDGVVRYIGKGRGQRASKHVWIANSLNRRRAIGETVRATKFHNRLAKAIREGSSVTISIIVSGLTDEEAFKREIAEIEQVADLWNMAPGGEGHTPETARAMWTDDYRARVAQSNSEAWDRNPARRERQREWAARINERLWADGSDYRQKQSARVKAECESPEKRKFLSDAARAMWTDEFRNRRSDEVHRQMVDRWSVDGAREARSAMSREMWLDPEFKERNRSAIQTALSRDDQKERARRQSKERWNDPAYKARVSRLISEGRRRKAAAGATLG